MAINSKRYELQLFFEKRKVLSRLPEGSAEREFVFTELKKLDIPSGLGVYSSQKRKEEEEIIRRSQDSDLEIDLTMIMTARILLKGYSAKRTAKRKIAKNEVKEIIQPDQISRVSEHVHLWHREEYDDIISSYNSEKDAKSDSILDYRRFAAAVFKNGIPTSGWGGVDWFEAVTCVWTVL